MSTRKCQAYIDAVLSGPSDLRPFSTSVLLYNKNDPAKWKFLRKTVESCNRFEAIGILMFHVAFSYAEYNAYFPQADDGTHD